jgi:hypothetical protein
MFIFINKNNVIFRKMDIHVCGPVKQYKPDLERQILYFLNMQNLDLREKRPEGTSRVYMKNWTRERNKRGKRGRGIGSNPLYVCVSMS